MGMLAQISDAVNAAFAEYKKEFGENTQITDGTEFVTVFNNCALIVRAEGDTLKNGVYRRQAVSSRYEPCNL